MKYIYIYIYIYIYKLYFFNICRTRHRGNPKNLSHDYGKRTDFWHLVLLGKRPV